MKAGRDNVPANGLTKLSNDDLNGFGNDIDSITHNQEKNKSNDGKIF